MSNQTRRRVVILGAGGRDFHNFNTVYRQKPEVEVLAFTATQIPGIDERTYPPVLAGPLYPKGIPIIPEESLAEFLRKHPADEAIHAYSDCSHQQVMAKASQCLALGLDFGILGPAATQIKSTKPVVAVLASRTGCGKSQTTRRVCALLKEAGKKVVAIRHPMPYGDLAKQGVQRFADGRGSGAPRVHDRGDGGVRASRRRRHGDLRRASTTRRSCARPRRRPTSSSGTAGTTTCRSTSRTSRSRWSIRCAPGTSSPGTPATRTSSPRRSSSSTRSTPPRWTR